MPGEPAFEVVLDADLDDVLVVGIAELGVGGLTAVDHCVSHLESTPVGHVRSRNLPDLTPFSDGVPRRPMRLYSLDGTGVTVLISEVFLPVWVAEPLADALIDAATERGVEEITVLNGGQFPHRETEHAVYHVATDGYRERHFGAEGANVPPLAGGFFDGVISELLVRGLDGGAPPVGVLVTPTHPPGPDLDAALRFLDALESMYDLSVDETELRERSEEMKRYYEELGQRLQTLQEEETPYRARDFPEDRMYM